MNDNENEKTLFTDDLITRLNISSQWRLMKNRAYPLDSRNLPAAKMLDRLASEMVITDDEWAVLQPHYMQPHTWAQAVAAATGILAFHHRCHG